MTVSFTHISGKTYSNSTSTVLDVICIPDVTPPALVDFFINYPQLNVPTELNLTIFMHAVDDLNGMCTILK